MTIRHLRLLLPLALAACAVKVNGTSYGPGSSGNSGSSGGNSGSSGSPSAGSSDDETPRYAAASSQCYETNDNGDDPPILTSPADPWLAVASDRPVKIRFNELRFMDGPACTAEHDHCLRDCAWFDADRDQARAPQRTHPTLYTGGDGDYTLYRTVPATKRMLTKGAIIVALDEMLQFPPPGAASLPWRIGVLDRVDWKASQLYLVGSPDPYWISSARVAVLSFSPGRNIEILGGRKRDELAVGKDELFRPLGDVVATSDPWSQVKNGQPIVVEDHRAFANVKGGCTPSRDHCLRPWAWTVDLGTGFAYTGRFDGKTFQGLQAVDEYERLDGIVAAYRTVPATRANLKVGARVFWGGGSEKAAHTIRWNTGKVTTIRDDGKVDVQRVSGTDAVPLDDLRIPVLVWYPGDSVEAFP